ANESHEKPNDSTSRPMLVSLIVLPLIRSSSACGLNVQKLGRYIPKSQWVSRLCEMRKLPDSSTLMPMLLEPPGKESLVRLLLVMEPEGGPEAVDRTKIPVAVLAGVDGVGMSLPGVFNVDAPSARIAVGWNWGV